MNHYRRLRGGPPDPGGQSGATLVMFTGFLIVLLTAVMLAIEVGRLYAAHSELQNLANVAALDAARSISGCRDDQPGNLQAAANTAVSQSIAGHDATDVIETSSAILGNIDRGGTFRSFDSSRAANDMREADAVQVTLQRDMPTLLTSFLAGSGNQLTATAAASQQPVGSVSVASRLADLDTQQSGVLNAVLGDLLGTNLNLSLAEYEALADADLTLLDLLDVTTQAATVEDLLALEITPGELLGNLGDAVDGTPGNILNSIAAGVTTPVNVALGEIVNVEAGTESIAANVPIDVLGILPALAQTVGARRGAVVELGSGVTDPLLGLLSLIPGLDIDLDLRLGVIEPPQPSGIGRAGYDDPDTGLNTSESGSTNDGARTWASTAQVNVEAQADATLNVLGLVRLHLYLPLFVQAAQGYAILDQISCAGLGNPQPSAFVDANSGLLRLGIGEFDNVFDPNPQAASGNLLRLEALGLLGWVDLASLDLPQNLTASADPGAQELVYDGPFVPQLSEPSSDNTKVMGSAPGQSLGNLVDSLEAGLVDYLFNEDPYGGLAGELLLKPLFDLLSALGFDSLLDLTASLLGTLLNGLDLLLEPVFDLLGLSLGEAEISVTFVEGDRPGLFATEPEDTDQ